MQHLVDRGRAARWNGARGLARLRCCGPRGLRRNGGAARRAIDVDGDRVRARRGRLWMRAPVAPVEERLARGLEQRVGVAHALTVDAVETVGLHQALTVCGDLIRR